MQVPGYLENVDALKKAGVDEVIVFCVNDGAVMDAWATDQKVDQSSKGESMATALPPQPQPQPHTIRLSLSLCLCLCLSPILSLSLSSSLRLYLLWLYSLQVCSP